MSVERTEGSGMKTFHVVCTGTAREVYAIDAVSPEDALERWADDGTLIVSEATTSPDSATEQE